MNSARQFAIRALRTDEHPLAPAFVQQLEPSLSVELISTRFAEMFSAGFELIGVWEGDLCVGIAGVSVRTHCFSGRVAYVENVVFIPEARNLGLGERLIAWIERYAQARGCSMVTLDTYQRNAGARKFYERLGYDPRGVHFVKELQ